VSLNGLAESLKYIRKLLGLVFFVADYEVQPHRQLSKLQVLGEPPWMVT